MFVAMGLKRPEQASLPPDELVGIGDGDHVRQFGQV